jgi:F0F1-type ATP synthase membrane subunit b/b'
MIGLQTPSKLERALEDAEACLEKINKALSASRDEAERLAELASNAGEKLGEIKEAIWETRWARRSAAGETHLENAREIAGGAE